MEAEKREERERQQGPRDDCRQGEMVDRMEYEQDIDYFEAKDRNEKIQKKLRETPDVIEINRKGEFVSCFCSLTCPEDPVWCPAPGLPLVGSRALGQWAGRQASKTWATAELTRSDILFQF